ncbi:hypothetical protein MTQ13_26250 [Streptomyces sp. XM4011]|uniref:hypothetical protein n=1 Tax=Streptomyces sp. XM4011 TaxID=2929780 RepID=UPI001FF7EB95|nr:hypothetical protein [Streptomyces sp. XM4011]MCK1817735.1 hypothetical protein [Streptomyces sp. XM4011]
MRLTRTRTAVAAGALAGLAALTLSSAGAATAAGQAPAFLETDDLPPHQSSDWFAQDIRQGAPELPQFCLGDVELPAGGTWSRDYYTDVDTTAHQLVVETGSAAEAQALAAGLADAVADCAADWLRENPGATAGWDDFGTVEAGDGARVFGVHTAPQQAGLGLNLFGVGRSGDTVTVVGWGEMGRLSDAPVSAFKETTAIALTKLGG